MSKDLSPSSPGDDEKRLTQLFNEQFHSLYHFAFKITDDIDQAKDIVQESFEKIWNKRAHTPPDNIRNYLYRIVHNASIDYLRDLKKRGIVEKGYALSRAEDKDFISGVTTESIILGEIHHYLDQLPSPRDKKLLILYFFQNKGLKEIAEQLGMGYQQAITEKGRAIERLRKLMPPELFLLLVFYNTSLSTDNHPINRLPEKKENFFWRGML